jgi:hypothetical protein
MPDTLLVAFASRGSATLTELFVAADQAGLSLDLVLPRPDRPEVFRAASRLFPRVLSADQAVRSAAGYAGVITFSDSLVRWCIDFSAHTGLGYGVPRAAVDKLTQRQTLVTSGLSHLWSENPRTLAEAQRVVNLRGPAYLKPRDGSNGEGVVRLEPGGTAHMPAVDLADFVLEQAIERPRTSSRPPWLADYVSVEVVVGEQDASAVAVFAKSPVVQIEGRHGPRYLTTGDVLPDGLSASLRHEVVTLAVSAVRALSIARSVCHVEIMLSDPPEVIEVNCRVGGHLSRLTNRTAGVDLIRVALMVAAGEQPRGIDAQAVRAARACGGFFFPFPREDGDVKSRVRPADLLELPDVVALSELARFGQPRALTGAIAANVVIEAADLDQLGRAVRDYLSRFGTVFDRDGTLEAPWYRDLFRRFTSEVT